MNVRTLQRTALATRLRARPLGLAALGLVALEALLGALGASLGGLQVLVLLLAPGLALLPLLPERIRALASTTLAAAPALGFAASSVAIITVSSLGFTVSATSTRIAVAAVVLAGLAFLRGPDLPERRPDGGVLWEALALAVAVAVGVVLQERVIGGNPVPGNDWAKYVLYADEIRRQGSLLIDNPYWMLGVPFREDPGAPALFGAYLSLSGGPAASVSHGIWAFAVIGVLSVFAYARAVFGPAAGAIAALFAAAPPITQDILAWHGLANVVALALMPLLLAYLTQLVSDGLQWRAATGFALALVATAAAHRLSFTVTLAGAALVLGIQLIRGEGRRRIVAGVVRTAAAVAAIGAGVAYDLIERNKTFGGTLGYESYEHTKVELWHVLRDLSLPFVVVAVAAVAGALYSSRRDVRLLPPLALLAVIVGLAYAWIVHLPLVYFRMAYYLPLVLAPLTAFALIRLLGTRRAAVAAAVLGLGVSALAWAKSDDLRGFYAFANASTLKGLDIVSARLAPGDTVVTDRCWSFLGTWLLKTPTLPALEPEDIQPKAELRRARQARAVLAGTPRGERLARRLGVRFLIVDPTCVTAAGEFAQPPVTGSPLFVSKRLVVLEVPSS